ncbi:MAG: RIP metalloprotease RseP [Thermodesulfobacteriota bacterium]
MSFLSALVLLGVLIFVHELGHFLFAKRLGIRVQKFSLGFGPRVIGKTLGETEYQIAAIPLGGFVKMLGEEPGESLPPEDLPRAFNHQPVWKRMLVVAAGPVFNILFASVLFSVLMTLGLPALTPEVGRVLEDSPALSAGLLEKDQITAIDGTPVTQWDELSRIIHDRPGQEIVLTVQRAGQTLRIPVTPREQTVQNIFGEDQKVGLIGISPSGSTTLVSRPVTEAVVWGVGETWEWCKLTVVSIVKLIQRVIPAKTLGGPIMILQMAGEQASRGPDSFFFFMAVISINLGVLNLFPIPILDGGHLLFMGIEALRGKPLNTRTMEIAQKVGLFVILGIMVFALYNDILRVFFDQSVP